MHSKIFCSLLLILLHRRNQKVSCAARDAKGVGLVRVDVLPLHEMLARVVRQILGRKMTCSQRGEPQQREGSQHHLVERRFAVVHLSETTQVPRSQRDVTPPWGFRGLNVRCKVRLPDIVTRCVSSGDIAVTADTRKGTKLTRVMSD